MIKITEMVLTYTRKVQKHTGGSNLVVIPPEIMRELRKGVSSAKILAFDHDIMENKISLRMLESAKAIP